MSALQEGRVGLIGLGVMGRNLAMNLLHQEARLSVYSYAAEEREAFLGEIRNTDTRLSAEVPDNLQALVKGLEHPRTILLMVTAGEAVDAIINDLIPLLSPGDILIDGGNSHYKDTMRRELALREQSISYIGAGISGGEEGARYGASLMVGCSGDAFQATAPIFAALSTEADGESCFGHLGADAAGHFVKMVHNGIEYGVMQLLAESYHLLNHHAGLSNTAMADVYDHWNRGRLCSYLVGITAGIFRKKDGKTDNFLIDVVSDQAGQKGTGRWTVDAAMELGVPVPGIVAAVTERQVSGLATLRKHLSGKALVREHSDVDLEALLAQLENTLYGSILSTYMQGLHLIRTASEHYGWQTDLIEVLKLWRGGCIIRAELLQTLISVIGENESAAHLLLTQGFSEELGACLSDWREVVNAGLAIGLPLPAMSASLNHIHSLHSSRLPLNLVQAQRDYFGAHTYERTDMPGIFHTDWVESDTESDE